MLATYNIAGVEKYYDIAWGCDGTDSRIWSKGPSNSHVQRFIANVDAKGGSTFSHGPTRSGAGVDALIDTGYNYVLNQLRTLPKAAEGAQVRIHLVGHSRGGLVAIHVAKRLAQVSRKVYFMGLWDAVNMTVNNVFNDVPNNVENAYHAIRDPIMKSRWSWGNCGMNLDTSHIAKFKTSHGGMGGSPDFEHKFWTVSDEQALTDEYHDGWTNPFIQPPRDFDVFTPWTERIGVSRTGPDGNAAIDPAHPYDVPLPTLKQLGVAEMNRAYQWIIQMAAVCGIPVS